MKQVAELTDVDLDRDLNEPQYNPLPTVSGRLVNVVADNLRQAGQLEYWSGLFVTETGCRAQTSKENTRLEPLGPRTSAPTVRCPPAILFPLSKNYEPRRRSG